MPESLKQYTDCLGYQQIAAGGLDAAVGLPNIPSRDPLGNRQQPVLARVVVETQAVRWRDDATAPTATVGMPLAVGTTLEYTGDLNKIRFISQTAGAVLNVSYYA